MTFWDSDMERAMIEFMAQPAEVIRRYRAGQGVPDLTQADPLAMAHDLPVRRVARDPLRVLVRPAPRLPDVRHDRQRSGRTRPQRQPRLAQQPDHVLGDAQRRRKPGGPDPGHARVPPRGIDADLVVRMLGRGA